jgi:hypothetical protein
MADRCKWYKAHPGDRCFCGAPAHATLCSQYERFRAASTDTTLHMSYVHEPRCLNHLWSLGK